MVAGIQVGNFGHQVAGATLAWTGEGDNYLFTIGLDWRSVDQLWVFMLTVLEDDTSVTPAATYRGISLELNGTFRSDPGELALYSYPSRPAISYHVFSMIHRAGMDAPPNQAIPMTFTAGASHASGQVKIAVARATYGEVVGGSWENYDLAPDFYAIQAQKGFGSALGAPGATIPETTHPDPTLRTRLGLASAVPAVSMHERPQPPAHVPYVLTDDTTSLGSFATSTPWSYTVPDELWNTHTVPYGTVRVLYQYSAWSNMALEVETSPGVWATFLSIATITSLGNREMRELVVTVPAGFDQTGQMRWASGFGSGSVTDFTLAFSSAGQTILTQTETDASVNVPSAGSVAVFGTYAEGGAVPWTEPLPRSVEFTITSLDDVIEYIFNDETVSIPAGLGTTSNERSYSIPDDVWDTWVTSGTTFALTRVGACTDVDGSTTPSAGNDLDIQVLNNAATWITIDDVETVMLFNPRAIILTAANAIPQSGSIRFVNNAGGAHTLNGFTYAFAASPKTMLNLYQYQTEDAYPPDLVATESIVFTGAPYTISLDLDLPLDAQEFMYGFAVVFEHIELPTAVEANYSVTMNVYSDDYELSTEQATAVSVSWIEVTPAGDNFDSNSYQTVPSPITNESVGIESMVSVRPQSQPNMGGDIEYGTWQVLRPLIGAHTTTALEVDLEADWLYLSATFTVQPLELLGRTYVQIVG